MTVMNQMSGKSFNSDNLEHVRNWLVERGLFAIINKEKKCIEVSGTVNGTWKEDVKGNLFRID